MGRAIEAKLALDSDRTKKSDGLTWQRRGRCLPACKVLGGFRSKMFDVKHFWNNSNLACAPGLWDSHAKMVSGDGVVSPTKRSAKITLDRAVAIQTR